MVALAEARVERQRECIYAMRHRGRSTDLAEETLAEFEALLALMRTNLAYIKGQLGIDL
jgi:hypothetical protein